MTFPFAGQPQEINPASAARAGGELSLDGEGVACGAGRDMAAPLGLGAAAEAPAANAKNNQGMKKKDLVVSECFADEGPVLKRFRPRAQGRAAKILKPLVHITVKVQERAQ